MQDKEFIVADDSIYEVKAVIAFLESKEDFIQHATDTAVMLKGKFDKIFIFGTVNQRVIQSVVAADKVGSMFIKLNNKENERRETNLGRESTDSAGVE